MSEKKSQIRKATPEKQNLRILINNTDDPMWLVDTHCVILECNNSFKQWITHFIGRELSAGDHVLGSDLANAYLQKFEMCYQLALNGKAFRTVEDMKIDGETHYTHVSFNPVFDNADKVIGVSCFARDITEQRQHLLKIEKQNIALREIASIESHKVRGAVATIMGLEQLFNYNDPADPENKEIMKGLGKMIHELDEIVRTVVKKSNDIEKEP